MLQLYIDKKWSPETIIFLINHGAKLSDNIIDLVGLPDDIFFDFTSSMSYSVDRALIEKCIVNNSVPKLEMLSSRGSFNSLDYFHFCDSSVMEDKLESYYFFIKYLEGNQILLFMLLLNISESYYGDDDNITNTVFNNLLSQLELTDEHMLCILLVYSSDSFQKKIYDRYTTINYAKNLINFNTDYNKYFKLHPNLSEIYEVLESYLYKNHIYVHFEGSEDDVNNVKNMLDQCRILLDRMD